MNRLWTLLVKDLRRARRNPWPFVINLAMPLLVTAMVGLIFGGASRGEGLGRIKIAIVDEDDTVISQFLRGSFDQGEAQEFIEPSFVDREEGLRLINNNKVSAMLVIPEGFMEQYLKGQTTSEIELLKNPAQSFYPAITEELLRVLAAGLNAISYNFQSDFPEWRAVFEKEGAPDMTAIANLMIRIGDKFEKAEDYLFPPLVTYTKETREKSPEEESGPRVNVFAYILPGLASMFLFFMADGAIRDLYREVEKKTFNRFRTFNQNVLVFISSKVLYAFVVLILGSLILFGGGGLAFQIDWQQPLRVVLLILAFSFFSAGFMAFLAALARSEKKADTINAMIIMGISFVGGSFFPANQLPAFIGKGISPYMPNYWFIESFRWLQFGYGEVSWVASVLKLSLFGVALIAISSFLLNRHFRKGGEA